LLFVQQATRSEPFLPMSEPVLYVDLGSPYAYLAVERAERVLGVAPRLEPILVGGVFAARGYGSWAHTDQRAANIAEIERRAAAYGLPALRWPAGWPRSTLTAMRAALWAEHEGCGEAFLRRGFRRAFVEGADLGDVDQVRALAAEVGLPADRLDAAVADPAIKQELRARTDAAIARGVPGVPTLVIGDRLLYGDDQLTSA
jgi:2-hydroxychromene-2-carboxylate isomerase